MGKKWGSGNVGKWKVGNVASPLADGSIAVQASAPILARCPAHAARLVRTLGKWESGKVESGKEVGKWERGKVESG